jgi:hypothetical protein
LVPGVDPDKMLLGKLTTPKEVGAA